MIPTDIHKTKLKELINEVHQIVNKCWAEIEPLIYIKEFNKNEYFSKEGQKTKEVGIVFSGILRVYYLNDKGEEWNKLFLLENNFVGSSISPEERSITNIQALTKAIIICIPYTDLVRLSTKYRDISSFIQKLTFSYLEQKQKREISLLSNEATQNYLDFQKKYSGLENKIQHYHIASYLGVTPNQLSRIRKKIE